MTDKASPTGRATHEPSPDGLGLPVGIPDAKTGWLIELNKAPLWLRIGEFSQGWTADSNEALRFSRQRDAEAFIRFNSISEARATEHRWEYCVIQGSSMT